MKEVILADIRSRLEKKTIYELRQIARAVGVNQPTVGRKERLVDEIVKITSSEISPVPESKRGAPPKSHEYDRELVADIEKCIVCYSAPKGEDECGLEISDGTSESDCEGILTRSENHYFLRVNGWKPSRGDIFVHESYVNRFGLEEGDLVAGIKTGRADESPALTDVTMINGLHADSISRLPYGNLTPIYPENRICLVFSAQDAAARMVDMFAPAGLGQRGIVCGPFNSGKTTLLKQIATGICRNHSHLKVVLHLISEHPEEATYLKRELEGVEIFYSTIADTPAEVAEAAEFVTRYCKKQVEAGWDVVLLADGLSKLERAARETGKSGAAKRLLSSAICAEEGGSLTVIATTNSEKDDPDDFNSELLQAANMRVVLSPVYAIQRRYPAIDVVHTSTAHNELLQSQDELKAADILRDKYLNADPDGVIKLFKNTENNEEIIKDVLNG